MDKNTIFYYRFQENGETVIGQAKFTTLRMKVNEMIFNGNRLAHGTIDYGEIIVAPSMKKIRIGKGSVFHVYPTFEDAVNQKNSVFDTLYKERPHFSRSFAETLDDTLQDVWDTLPECLDLEQKSFDSFVGGRTIYYVPVGYKWDGTKAICTAFVSEVSVVDYDLLEHQCVVTDWNALDGVYYSEEKCKAHNTVKCYTF